MKKITDSFIFNQALKNDKTKQSITGIVLSRDSVKIDSLSESLSIINKRMKYPGKVSVLDKIGKNQITFIYNPTLVTPKYLSTTLRLVNGEPNATVNLTDFGKIDSMGNFDIYPKTLFSLAQTGVVYLEMNKNWNRYINNVAIVKNGAIVYAQMFGKVLDKLYAIKIDSFKSDLIHFMIAKFFLINMCGRANTETTNNIAYYAAFNKSSYELIKAEEENYPDSIYSNIEVFLKALAKQNLNGLGIRVFLENWTRMFGESTILGMDYLPSFLGTIFSVAINGNLCKDYIIEAISGKQIDMLYHEFFKTLGK